MEFMLTCANIDDSSHSQRYGRTFTGERRERPSIKAESYMILVGPGERLQDAARTPAPYRTLQHASQHTAHRTRTTLHCTAPHRSAREDTYC